MKKIFYLVVFYIIIVLSGFNPAFAEALRATPTKAQIEAQKAQASDEENEEADTVPAKINLTRDQILIVQAALNNAGHLCQRSGVVGKKTVRALRRFQAKQGLPVTGKIDIETLKVLGVYKEITGQK